MESKKFYVAVDIGCIECLEESNVLGIFTKKEKAEKVIKEHSKRQQDHWGGQHEFEIFVIDEIDKEYEVEY